LLIPGGGPPATRNSPVTSATGGAVAVVLVGAVTELSDVHPDSRVIVRPARIAVRHAMGNRDSMPPMFAEREPAFLRLRHLSADGSTLVRWIPVVRQVNPDGVAIDVMHFGPGAVLGRHPAGLPQLFLVAAGSGWIATGSGRGRPRLGRRQRCQLRRRPS